MIIYFNHINHVVYEMWENSDYYILLIVCFMWPADKNKKNILILLLNKNKKAALMCWNYLC